MMLAKKTAFIKSAMRYYDDVIARTGAVQNLGVLRAAVIHKQILRKESEIVSGYNISELNGKLQIGDKVSYNDDSMTQLEGAIVSVLTYQASARVGSAISRVGRLDPFYSAILNGLRKEYVGGLNCALTTMGVNPETFAINVEFVYALPTAELNFILLHEIGHIAGLHAFRGIKSNHDLWNDACDYYINKRLAVEYKLEPINLNTTQDSEAYSYPTVAQKPSSAMSEIPLRMAMHSRAEIEANPLLICGLYDPTVDLEKDTPETIYKRLLNSEKSGKGGGYGPKGEGGTNNGQCAKGGQNSKNGNFDSKELSKKLSEMSDEEFEKAMRKLLNDINKGGAKGDKNGNCRTPTSLDKQKATSLIQQAVTKAKLAGTGSCSELRKVAIELTRPKFNIRSYIRQYLRPLKTPNISYANINKRVVHLGLTLPANGALKNKKLTRVKLCIDTSGSISQKELMEFFSLIQSVLLEYKVSAELICWDTKMCSLGEIKSKTNMIENMRELKRCGANLSGGGGTDPSCVFEYFNSKKCSVKPMVTIILTDGFIGGELGKYARQYKNTLWIISKDGDKEFRAPFGLAVQWKNIDRN